MGQTVLSSGEELHTGSVRPLPACLLHPEAPTSAFLISPTFMGIICQEELVSHRGRASLSTPSHDSGDRWDAPPRLSSPRTGQRSVFSSRWEARWA